jgi:GAF domain-containing protein
MIRRQALISYLRSRWKDIWNLEEAVPEPGFVGLIPCLVLLRWLFAGGTLFRFMLHRNEYSGGEWSLILALFGVIVVLAVIATLVTTRPTLRCSKRIQGLFIALDVFLISLSYFLTRNPQSDLFLFYYLPIFAATEYLGGGATLIISAVIAGAFASAIALQPPTEPPTPPADLLLRVFLPRVTFFMSVVLTSSFLLRLERTQRQRASQREAEIQTLLDFKAEVGQLFDVNQVLERTLSRAVEIAGATGGHISVVDYDTGQLVVRFHTPQEYFRDKPVLGDSLSRQVIHQKQARRLKDIHADPDLNGVLSRGIHSLLCVPIMAHNTVLGTLSVASTLSNHFGEDTERFLQALAGQAASAIERARLLTALDEIGAATTGTLELDTELDAILHELTERLRFEFAAVSLVDDYRRTVEMTRSVNVPPGWMRRSRHSLDSSDIQADVAHTGKTEVIEGWDERFDPEIYERFGHANFARVFAPLVADGGVVGTIEAGCRRERRAEILTSENIQAVQRLGQERGLRVARMRPHRLLELIANRAIKIIGADSASIHVYQSEQLMLEAGAGKAGKEFLAKFPPRKRGIGSQAMQTDQPIAVDRPQDLVTKHRALYDEGVRAIAAFPLSIGAHVRGVLYVHFWQEHQFSQSELELEKVFARQMEVVIQNTLLLKNISEAAHKAWALSGLQNVIQSLALAPSLNLTQVLEDVAQNVLYMLDADNVTLYQYFQENKRFEFPPVMKGSFRDRVSMQLAICPAAIVWEILQDGQTRFISDVSRDPVLSGSRSNGIDKPRFVEREGIKSSAVVVLKAGQAGEIVGLLFVNYRTPHEFSPEDRKTVNTLASSAAIAIETARLYDRVSRQLQRRDEELEALRAVDRAIVSSARPPDIQPVLEFILDKGREIVKAPVGALMWFNQWKNILELRAQRGLPEDQQMIRQSIGEGIVGLAAQTRESILVPDVTDAEWARVYKQVVPNTRSELAVPLVDEGGILGVLNMEHPEVGAFSEDDQALLETLAVQTTIAIHSVDLYRRLERQVESLRSLTAIAIRIQDARYGLETVLRLLLTGVTAGEGLGFSRAMLFLANDGGTKLQGKMAVGAQTRREAEAVWKRLDEKADDLRARGENVLAYLLDQAEDFSIAIAEGRESECPLSKAIQSTSVPIEESAGALSSCILQEKTIIIADTQPDPFRDIIERISQPGDRGRAFVCVPLIGRGKIIGVMAADNRFLVNERGVDKSAISCLEAFAGVAAMSVENARLQTRLAEEQRQATWKEFTASVAHTIGTRVAVIEGVVTQLRCCLLEENGPEDEQMEIAQTYLAELTNGIQKANMVLAEYRRFVTPLELRFEELNLAQMLRSVIQEIRYNLDFAIRLITPDDPLTIQGDPLKLSDAFIELIRNAQEAMRQDTGRSSQLTITASLEALSAGPVVFARIEFADTGPGIPETDKKRIFDPYYGTSSKGSGLGLAIVKRVIGQHNGTIEEVGIPGTGARFVVRLPKLNQDHKSRE